MLKSDGGCYYKILFCVHINQSTVLGVPLKDEFMHGELVFRCLLPFSAFSPPLFLLHLYTENR